MRGDDNFIIITPHSFGSFNTYLVTFFGYNLSGLKALKSVIGNITSELAVPLFGCGHLFICFFSNAVDTGDKHFLIGFIVVFSVFKSSGKVIVKIFALGSFIWIVGIIDYCLFT